MVHRIKIPGTFFVSVVWKTGEKLGVWKKEEMKDIFINLENSCWDLMTNKEVGESSQGI